MPADHVYVHHLDAPNGSAAVRRLADPRPCQAPSDQAGWWPPVMLDPAWVRAHRDEFDVFHVHFGFDAQPVEALRELVDELRRHGRPLVYTAHDLRNPHHRDPQAHDAHLDVLIPAADHVITLTRGAADVIRRRWGRQAEVLPHPHVVPLDELERPRGVHDGFVVGIHAKSVRANMDLSPVIEVLTEAIAALPGARLRIDVHDEVTDPSSPHHDSDLITQLRRGQAVGDLELQIHPFFSDDQLWCYLRDEIDVSVLPYRFGTHSGWLEACHDLGTIVLAPTCGFYAEQRSCLSYSHDEATGLDPGSLVDAVSYAYERRPRSRATRAGRQAERIALAAAHHSIYTRTLG